MQVDINNKMYNVEIVKKITNRNTYIRVRDDLTIYVTTNKFVSNKSINKLILENKSSILKMIEKIEKKKSSEDYFWYLGRKYEMVYTNDLTIAFGEAKVFIPHNFDIDKWYKKEANILFLERLKFNYDIFSKNIPFPKLTVRKMKSRWGVCNTRLNRVTLNLELIKKDISCLDYVIMHELSHFIYHDHSKNFWELVEENYKDYKKVRKLMKED